MVVKGKRVCFALLITACIASFALMFVFWNAASAYAGGRWEVSSTKKLISPGVTENYVVTNDSTNSDQVIGYAVTVDLSKNTLMVGYKDYNPSKWGLQTVRDQAKAMEKATGVTVVAAVNGDFFNMSTGEPTGALVMNGVQYHGTERESLWFGITKDNQPLIGSGAVPENIKEAIGANVTLIEGGQVTAGLDAATKQPRTAVGIDANGKVVVIVADGRQAASSGYTLSELADEMLRLGCVDAVNLDGGGSTTYAARYAGESALTVANSPSDGVERLVSSSLMIVTQAEASGVFGEAVLNPNNDVYTPGSEIQFQAKAVDTNGFAMEMPANVTWRLTLESEALGTIDANGLFIANDGIEGTVGVELVYEEKVVGTTSVEIYYPDTLKFGSNELSLGFGAESDLGLHALHNHREVIIKDGDLAWTIGVSDNEQYPEIGTMRGNTFVASEDATNSTAIVSVAVADRKEISASISVTVGQLPTVVWDFEDHIDETTGQTIPAEEYYNVNAEGSLFQTFHYNNGSESAEIVHISSGEPVRMGSYSLRMNYDFTKVTITEGACFGMTEEYKIPGKPTALGVWVYVPENTPNFWFRAYINNYKSDGTLIKSANVVNFTAQSQKEADNFGIPYYEGTIPAGWHYFEAPLATFDGTQLVPFSGDYYTLMAGQTFRLMYVPSIPMGQPTKGYVYYDNFQFVYGSNTNDLNAPVIENVSVNGQALSDGMTIAESSFSIQASYHELEEKYASGVNTDNLHVYVDGKQLKLLSGSETELNTENITLPDGTHRIEVSVFDNFQNESRKSFMITVAADTVYDTVFLAPQSDAPTLNRYYGFDVIATNMEKTSTVTFEMKLGLGLTLVAQPGEFDVFTVECVQKSAINNTYEVKISRTGQALSGTGTVAQLKILMEKSLVQGSVFSYSLLSGSVAFDEFYQEDITNTFILQSDQQEVEAYYEISADTMIVGSEGGYIYVTHGGLPAQGVSVYLDGVVLPGITDAEGKIFTDRFVSEACIKNIQAEDSQGNVSFSLKVYGVLPCGDDASSAPMFIASKASVDSQTSHNIGWMSNPLFADKAAQVKYALKSEYDAKGEASFAVFEGESTIVELSASRNAAENYAVLFNEVRLTGLQKDADYVYIVGNGTVWSEIHSFSTKRNGTDTNFFVMGDTQLEDKVLLDHLAQAIRQDGVSYDFGIQTGDFVDNTNSYSMWSEIMGAFSEYFGNTDMIQVLGNHEFYGDNDGSIASTFHMLPDTDWYSVMYGNTYVAVVNYSVTNNVNEMAKIFAEVAADAKQSKAVWKVLTLHQPPYYTNSAGGNEYVNQIVPQYVDEGGFDVVFSGHDHAYARTKPMKGGIVDESGTVYIVSGAVSDKGYEPVNNPSFNFETLIAAGPEIGGYTAVYISVQATENTFTIQAYDVVNGSAVMIDSYTIGKDDECTANGHTFIYKSGYLGCDLCGFSIDPVANSYSGMVIDSVTGRRMMFDKGNVYTGWFYYGTDLLYFGEDGVAAQGEITLTDENLGDFTYIFDNGKVVGGETKWYGNKYYVNGNYVTGWLELNGSYYYLWTGGHYDANFYPYELGEKVRGGLKRVTVNMGNYDIPVYFYFDDSGKLLGPVNGEAGEMIPGNFYYRDNIDTYSYMIIYTDQQGKILGDFYENGWLTANGTGNPDAEGNRYYIRWDWLTTGEQVIGGVKYRFAQNSGDPISQGNGVLQGRYYHVRFNQDDASYTVKEIFENSTVTPEEAKVKDGNSIKYYEFLGWYSKGKLFDFSTPVTSDITLTATYSRKYVRIYGDMVWALEKLQEADSAGNFDQIKKSIHTAEKIYGQLTAEQISDCQKEGISFALYEQMKANLFEVSFTNNGIVFKSSELYKGETIEIPAGPEKSGNSIYTYEFIGWYNGENKLETGTAVTENTVFEARYRKVYAECYDELKAALDTLIASQSKSPEEQKIALYAATEAYEKMSQTQRDEAQAEGLDYALYKEMLDNLFQVKFSFEGEIVGVLEVYRGESIEAPAAPEKQGNSIKSYIFSGWYHEEEKFDSTKIVADTTFNAQFEMVYSEKYNQMIEALLQLSAFEEGTYTQKYEALSAVNALYKDFSESEINDAQEEGMSFELYRQMLADFNALVDSGKEDMESAESVANTFLTISAALLAMASLAYVFGFRR